MKSRIQVLPDSLRNKISAGEIIERPASVVKELLENAIDAGADRISVDVREGGQRSIRVPDNGEGMTLDDTRLAFERHATSKLSREEDLQNIRTMGFRGEALPSIASVSKVRLVTALKGAVQGSEVSIHGGTFMPPSKAPAVP
ncbi:MAG TPA: DNA mismatch repair endonuclease MutL, partial [Nitrospiria bacterium]|nr:DNA mismatch repair endonuclease MutL [Nitrospiria bacterium]